MIAIEQFTAQIGLYHLAEAQCSRNSCSQLAGHDLLLVLVSEGTAWGDTAGATVNATWALGV